MPQLHLHPAPDGGVEHDGAEAGHGHDKEMAEAVTVLLGVMPHVVRRGCGADQAQGECRQTASSSGFLESRGSLDAAVWCKQHIIHYTDIRKNILFI